MKKFKLVRLFHKIHILERLYNYQIVKNLYQKLFVSSLPVKQYIIELTNRCNADCIFCTYPTFRGSGKLLLNMDEDTFIRVLEIIKEFPRNSISLTPTTGEVLMNQRWNYYLQQILNLDFVENVYFYSNAVLLNNDNQNKLFKMRNLDKLSISLSTGGVDRDTYKLLFGKDSFDLVQANISNFVAGLKDRSLNIPVSIDIKLPINKKVSIPTCRKTYNSCKNTNVFIKTRTAFDNFSGLIHHQYIDKLKPISKGKNSKPCSYLDNIRFAPNCEVWLCGCVTSELPGHSELKVGSLDGKRTIPNVQAFQNNIKSEWIKRNNIPYPCKECTARVQ